VSAGEVEFEFRTVSLFELQNDSGVQFGELGHQVRDRVLAKCEWESELHDASLRIAVPEHVGEFRFQLAEQSACPPGELLTKGCEAHTTTVRGNELRSEFLFKRMDPSAHGRLRNAEAFGCFRHSSIASGKLRERPKARRERHQPIIHILIICKRSIIRRIKRALGKWKHCNFLHATGVTMASPMSTADAAVPAEADVLLVGAGIMSATLGALLTTLDPSLKIVVLEAATDPVTESSNPWNNAGTGHAGYCELNYMPNPKNGARSREINKQYRASKAWWEKLEAQGLLKLDTFLASTPHMSLVFGQQDVEYLHTRYLTLSQDPLFDGLEYSENPEQIAKWAPLTEGVARRSERIAATYHPNGSDIDFGALTQALLKIVSDNGGTVAYGYKTTGLKQRNGEWLAVCKSVTRGAFTMRERRVFAGTGGQTLRTLQKAKMPEIKQYGVLPVGAAFYRTFSEEVTAQHRAKVYSQSAVGAPPMSVPHLDARRVGGKDAVMFGPYATFSTKLLKHGSIFDFFATLTPGNLTTVIGAIVRNTDLIIYLIGQLTASKKQKFRELLRFAPNARPEDWELFTAGQRAQLVKRDANGRADLVGGAELVVSADGTLAGVLGASPGASTAYSIMTGLVTRVFPELAEKME